MGAITTIVVPDAATTPVNHTFTPVGANSGSASWLEQSASSASGFWPLVQVLRAPLAGQSDKLYRHTTKLSIPIQTVETINGVSRTITLYTLRANVEFVIPADATLQNRKDLRKLMVGILNDASTIAQVESLQNLY